MTWTDARRAATVGLVLALAAACGGAAAMSPLSVGFDKDTALSLKDKIEITKLER